MRAYFLFGGTSVKNEKYDAEICIRLLRAKQEQLVLSGESRYPQRSDFDNGQVVAIKAFLGPWPRALEAAGLKEERANDPKQLNREKRMRAKMRRREETNK